MISVTFYLYVKSAIPTYIEMALLTNKDSNKDYSLIIVFVVKLE